MTKALEKLPVIFRKDCDGHPVAVFPTLPYNTDPDLMTVYAHIGQHGSGSMGWYHQTPKAASHEYAGLLDELRSIYEREPDAVELVPYQRMTAKHREAFNAQRYAWLAMERAA